MRNLLRRLFPIAWGESKPVVAAPEPPPEPKREPTEVLKKVCTIFKTHPLAEWKMKYDKKTLEYVFSREGYPWSFRAEPRHRYDGAAFGRFFVGEDEYGHKLHRVERRAITNIIRDEIERREEEEKTRHDKELDEKLLHTYI